MTDVYLRWCTLAGYSLSCLNSEQCEQGDSITPSPLSRLQADHSPPLSLHQSVGMVSLISERPSPSDELIPDTERLVTVRGEEVSKKEE